MGVNANELTTEAKIELVLAALKQKKSREAISRELGYASYQSMDMMLRRHGYVWDTKSQQYMKKEVRAARIELINRAHTSRGKERRVIYLFDEGELDPKEIAAEVGFADHREMAAYMKSIDYVWDARIGNYVPAKEEHSEGDSEPTETAQELEQPSVRNQEPRKVMTPGVVGQELRDFVPCLEWLQKNMTKLESLIGSDGISNASVGHIPRYVVPGVPTVKSVHMSNELAQLCSNFSIDKNISQKELFIVALVEFFRKYGYSKEIDDLLASA